MKVEAEETVVCAVCGKSFVVSDLTKERQITTLCYSYCCDDECYAIEKKSDETLKNSVRLKQLRSYRRHIQALDDVSRLLIEKQLPSYVGLDQQLEEFFNDYDVVFGLLSKCYNVLKVAGGFDIEEDEENK